MLAMRFIFEGGDGDQDYFGESFIAERKDEPWFPEVISGEPAYLARILTGHHKGEYLALTSRVVASLKEQLNVRDYLSIVVHVIHKTGPSFVSDDDSTSAIGMAAVKVVMPSNPMIFSDPW